MQERRSRLLDLSSSLCQSHNPRHSLIVARISNRSTSAEHPSAHHHKSKSSSTTRGLHFLRDETKRKEEYASLGHHQNAARPTWKLKTNRQKTQSYRSFFPRKTKPITLEARRSKTSLIGISLHFFFLVFRLLLTTTTTVATTNVCGMQPHQLLLLRIVLTNNKPHPPGPCGWRELKNDVVESHIRLHLHSPRLSLLLILKSPAHPFPFAIQDSAVLLCSSPPPPPHTELLPH